jgi:hypothetical protein
MNAEEVFTLFVEAINRHDLRALTDLMTPDHVFIDSLGHRVEWPPSIPIEDVLSLLGQAVDHGLPPLNDLNMESDPLLTSLHGDPRFCGFGCSRQRARCCAKGKLTCCRRISVSPWSPRRMQQR